MAGGSRVQVCPLTDRFKKKKGRKKQKKGKRIKKGKREHTLVLVDRRIGSGRAVVVVVVVVVVNRRQTTVESSRGAKSRQTKRGNRGKENGAAGLAMLRFRLVVVVISGCWWWHWGGAGERLAALHRALVREPATPAWESNRSGLVAGLVEGTKLEVWEFCGDSGFPLNGDLRGSHFRFNQPTCLIPCFPPISHPGLSSVRKYIPLTPWQCMAVWTPSTRVLITREREGNKTLEQH